MTDADRDDRDDRVVRAMQRTIVPDHAPDFWDRLDQRLALVDDAAAGTGHPGARAGGSGPQAPDGIEPAGPGPSLPPPAGRRRRLPPRLLAAAAAVLAVAGAATAAILLLPDDGDRVEIGPSDSRGAPATRAPTGPAATDGQTASEATDAVLGFIDALGTGDLEAAADRLGPRSRAVLQGRAGPVEAHLREFAEGYGTWASAPDRTTRAVPLGSRRAVVVVSGEREAEGFVEERHDAFPVRQVEADGPWLVEPTTTDPASGASRLRVSVTPQEQDTAPPTIMERVEVTTPGAGTAWLSVDGAAPRRTAVGPERTATWVLDESLSPGSHTLVVAFADGDATFTALAQPYVVEP